MVVSRPTRAPRPRFETLDFAMDLEEAIVLPLVRRAPPRPLPIIVDKRRLAENIERTLRVPTPAAPRVVPRMQSLVDAWRVERAAARCKRRAISLALVGVMMAAMACAFVVALAAYP